MFFFPDYGYSLIMWSFIGIGTNMHACSLKSYPFFQTSGYCRCRELGQFITATQLFIHLDLHLVRGNNPLLLVGAISTAANTAAA